MDARVGDVFVWHRIDSYGGPVLFDVTKVMPTTFYGTARGEGWRFRFRKSDGMVMGNRHNCFSVRPYTGSPPSGEGKQ